MILATPMGVNHYVSRGDAGGSYVDGLGSAYWSRFRRDRDPVGLISVASAIRLLSSTISSFVMRPYSGDASRRQPLFDAPQAALLQDAAPGYCTSSDLWSDVVTEVELNGWGLIYKDFDGDGIVRGLWPFPAFSSRIWVDEHGDRRVTARVHGELKDITRNVIVVRGWSPISAVEGASAIRLHETSINGMFSMQEYRGRYFDSDASPNLLLTHPGNPTTNQRREFRESWNERHQGPTGEKTGFLWGGITAKQLASTLEEAQIAELSGLDKMEVAEMFQIYPLTLMSIGEERTLPVPEQLAGLFHRISLMGRMMRIQRAVSADRDIFPDRSQYAQFDTSAFLAGDLATIASMVHALKQVGVITANEGRARLGEPPSDDPAADKLLETPVGAAPNATDPNPNGADPNG